MSPTLRPEFRSQPCPRLIAPNQLQLALTIIQRELVDLTEYQAPGVKIQQPVCFRARYSHRNRTGAWRNACRHRL